MVRPLIAGNWKMHKTIAQATTFVSELSGALSTDAEVRLYPPFTALAATARAAADTAIAVGAQNLHDQREGAFTGEVSADMLTDAGATSVLVGHSERRHLFGEDDAWINRKVHAAIRSGLDVVLCVGETLDERDGGHAQQVVERQIRAGLDAVPANATVDVAYEPVWAIGTGRTATPEQAQEMHAFIRTLLNETGIGARILYGGSVKPGNAEQLLACQDIDGVLVGGASLEPESFAQIIAAASTAS
ncbi:MAG: triose-phosphate isomerase [Candidatus Dadabacteria bacterium]|nr:MAG: triose-phosphate isomerase [Candidatus Dadabacteria bacterium]